MARRSLFDRHLVDTSLLADGSYFVYAVIDYQRLTRNSDFAHLGVATDVSGIGTGASGGGERLSLRGFEDKNHPSGWCISVCRYVF